MLEIETFTKGLTVVFALYAFISVALGIQYFDRLSWEASALLLFLVTEFIQGIFLLTSKKVKIPVQNPMNLLPPLILSFLTIVAGGEALQTMKQSPMGNLGAFLFYLGLMGSFLATVSIGRSFGVFAEVREIQMTGIYQWVRHPIYSSYFLQYTGVALVSNSIFTTSLLAAAAFLQIRFRLQTYFRCRLIPLHNDTPTLSWLRT